MATQSIAQIATDNNFSILLAAVGLIDANTDADLAGALSSPGSLTVFAPTNAAFGALATDLGFTGDASDEAAVTTFLVDNVPVETLRAVVEYHVLGTVERAEDIAAASELTTLNGLTITPDLPTLVDNEPDAIDPSLVDTNIEATNGVVHVIDRVLLPVDLPQISTGSFTDLVIATSGASGFDTNGADFDLLREALVATGLDQTLDMDSLDLTVFAPTDAAFVSLSQTLGYGGSDEAGALSYLLDALNLLNGGNGAGPLLETVLKYHVSGESLQASQVLESTTIETLADVDIGVNGTTLEDADPDLTDPSLIATDIQATNGVLHVIDEVLIPADLLQSNGANDVDFVIAGDGRNFIFTGRDNDLIDAGGGRDLVFSGSGNDLVLGGRGRDIVFGGSGDDTIKGEWGHDKLLGNFGDDDISGGSGRDHIFGGLGDDILAGDGAADRLFGGWGDDTLEGGRGRDVLSGGWGDDVFVFGADFGRDLVNDFRIGHDQIDLSALGTSWDSVEHQIHGNGRNTRIELDEGTIILRGVNDAHLDEDDFIF
ncbi:MAG: fasciclin domain-containing protein [Pseudomonadota bacterium]